jgi:regulator of sigma E protease
MQILIYLASVALVLGVLVFIHEFGHYAVAKLCGVRVEVFSLGFGKRLLGFQRGGTDYRLSLLPLGGYVKMAGENPLETRTGDPGEFTSHPRWQRFLIAIAGPAMNIVFALVVLTLVYMFHHEYAAVMEQPAYVLSVTPDSPAARAGVQPGDTIVKINDVQNPTWEQVLLTTGFNPKEAMDVTLQRGGQTVQTKVMPEATGPDRVGSAGWNYPEVIGTVEAGFPADQAGIKPGDILLSVNSVKIQTTEDLFQVLQQTKGEPVDLRIVRQGKEFNVKLKPELRDSSDDPQKRYRIGVTAAVMNKLPFAEAAARSYEECKTGSVMIFQLVGKLIEAKVSIRQASGPIGIAKISGQAAMQKGWTPLFEVMAIISLNLAVFNLFPIPILDGGLMLMLLIEAMMRRDIKQEIKERVYQAAFVFLVLFAVVVICSDVAKTLPGLS